jgi:hypothetical protein
MEVGATVTVELREAETTSWSSSSLTRFELTSEGMRMVKNP